MDIINLTPHSIVLRTPAGTDVTLPPSGVVARVGATPGALREVSGVPVPVAEATVYGGIEGLSEPAEDTIYIVSGLVLSRAFGRTDVFGPGTGPNDGAIRDDQGRVIAVTRLVGAPKS